MKEHNTEDKIEDRTVGNQNSVIPASIREKILKNTLKDCGDDFITYLSLSADSPDLCIVEETLEGSDHRLWT